MRLFGRGLLVFLVLCLGLAPARSEAATISFGDDLALSSATDVFFLPLPFDGPSLLTVEVTAEFFPVLTLFAVDDASAFKFDQQGYAKLAEFQTFDLSITFDQPFELPGPGPYLLALSQQPFVFSTGLAAFETTTDVELTALLEGCGGFLGSDVDGCGSGGFTGSFSLQSVPEPGTLSLLALGVAAFVARRRRKRCPNEDTA